MVAGCSKWRAHPSGVEWNRVSSISGSAPRSSSRLVSSAFSAARGFMEGRLPLLFHGDVGASSGVDVPAQLGEQRNGGGPVQAGGPNDQRWALFPGFVEMLGETFHTLTVGNQRRGDQGVNSLVGRWRRSELGQECGQFQVAAHGRHLRRALGVRGPQP